MLGPESIIGSDMEDELASLCSARKRFGIAQITRHTFNIELTDLAGGTA